MSQILRKLMHWSKILYTSLSPCSVLVLVIENLSSRKPAYLHDTLNSAVEPPAGVGHHGLVQIGHHLSDVGLQRCLGVMRGRFGFPLTNASQGVVTRAAVWWISGSIIPQPELLKVLLQPRRYLIDYMVMDTILLEDVVTVSSNSLHPGLHHGVHQMNVYICIYPQALLKQK